MEDLYVIIGLFAAAGWSLFIGTVIVPRMVWRKFEKGGFDKHLFRIGNGILSRAKSGGTQADGGQAPNLENMLAEISQAVSDAKPTPPKGHAAKGTMQGGMDPSLMGQVGALAKQLQSDPEVMKGLLGSMPEGMQQGTMIDGIKDIVPTEYRKYLKNPFVQTLLNNMLQKMMQKQLSGGNSPVNMTVTGSSTQVGTQYKKVI